MSEQDLDSPGFCHPGPMWIRLLSKVLLCLQLGFWSTSGGTLPRSSGRNCIMWCEREQGPEDRDPKTQTPLCASNAHPAVVPKVVVT